MSSERSVALVLVCGLAAASALAQPVLQTMDGEPLARPGPHANDVRPAVKAGVLYVNLETGQRSLTRYFDARGKIAVPEITDTHAAASTGVLFDYWMSIDENPCWDDPRADGFGVPLDRPTDGAEGYTEPIAGFDFGDICFDSAIGGLILTTATLATESTDSNNDGTLDSGLDTVAVFYDGLSEGNRTSIAPPTAVIRVESIPGYRGSEPVSNATPALIEAYDIVVDFGNGNHFEIGDSDGQSRGSLWLPGANPGFDVSSIITTPSGATTVNTDPDGLADFQFLQHYARHGTVNKITQDSTFLGIGMPEGSITFTTYTTWTHVTSISSEPCTQDCFITVTKSYFIPDVLPQAQGIVSGYGLAQLGAGADVGALDWTIGGCCFWFGGLDCAGFLSQVNPAIEFDPTWYNFVPYAQLSMGLFSNQIPGSLCSVIDFNGDTFLDNGDIGAFVQFFIAQNLSTDLNGDGVVDNGDIGTFVAYFLACTGGGPGAGCGF